MPRRGRSPVSVAPRRTSTLPAHRPPAAPAPVAAAPPPMAAAQPQQPGLFAQMAATAGGVAVGSAIGHTVGHAMTGMFSGGGSSEAAAPDASAPAGQLQQHAAYANEQTAGSGPCAWEIQQFLQCAQGQADLTLCEGFNEALRQCKTTHNM